MSYCQLTAQERYVIYHLKLYKFSAREIGRRLNRHLTTIQREVKRNAPPLPTSPYWHEGAHEQALQRRKQLRHYRRLSNKKLVGYITQRIKLGWSPQIIAGHLKRAYPKDGNMRSSPEPFIVWCIAKQAKAGRCIPCSPINTRGVENSGAMGLAGD